MVDGNHKSAEELLDNRKKYCESKATAHDNTARRLGLYDTLLAAVAIICSALISAFALSAAVPNTTNPGTGQAEQQSSARDPGGQENGATEATDERAEEVSFRAQWAGAALAAAAAIMAALQKLLGYAKLSGEHDQARSSYRALADEAEVARNKPMEPNARWEELTRIDAQRKQTEGTAPRPFKMFESEISLAT